MGGATCNTLILLAAISLAPGAEAQSPTAKTRRVLLVIWTRPLDRSAFLAHKTLRRLAPQGLLWRSVALWTAVPEETVARLLRGDLTRAARAADPASDLCQALHRERTWGSWQTWLLSSLSDPPGQAPDRQRASSSPALQVRRVNVAPLFRSPLFQAGAPAAYPTSLDLLVQLTARGAKESADRASLRASEGLRLSLLANLRQPASRRTGGAQDRAVLAAAGALLARLPDGLVVAVLGETMPTKQAQAADSDNLDRLGTLWDRVAHEHDLAGSTTLFLVPTRLRSSPAARRSRKQPAPGMILALGPEFSHGRTVSSVVQAGAVCGTIARLLGAPAFARNHSSLKAAFR